PSTEEGWLKIAKEFDEKRNSPHCLGALDGKHVILQTPVNSGSEYFNYKHEFSIVFLLVWMEERKKFPIFFLGDEAFALSQHLMKVFPGMYPADSKKRVFNCRVCRARKVVENVFEISSSVFRVLSKPLLLQPENETLSVMAVAHLHNFLRRNKESFNLYSPLGSMDYEVEGKLKPGSWRNDNNEKRTSLLQLQRIPKRPPRTAMEIRNELADFFTKEGKIPCQNQHA
ncbi:hypothetical protein B7P43_G15415, partial [Cryptotermes secundus]